MNQHPIIVLKFGSSVFRSVDDPPRLIHEVYRWLRKGYRVVAVVSALEGETDRLLSEAHRWERIPHPSATALLASTGELRSAALLALALDRAGIEAQVLDVAAIGLRTRGSDALDARPLRFNVAKLRGMLRRFPVIVLPGYLGRDADGSTTLLGRGGSDCSALFLAGGLGARCRLVKDVDGLYEWDPQQPGPKPRRFRQLGWGDALQLDGGIVQHKAIEFARQSRQTFEVGCLFRQPATEIGAWRTTFDEQHTERKPLRVLLLGLGNVGRGVYQALRSVPDFFQVVGVAVRDKQRRREVPSELLFDDLNAAARIPCDVLVELLGGSDPARRAIGCALRRGRHVVTANKRVISESGAALESLAREQGVAIRWSAAVGGSVPLLEHLQNLPLDDRDFTIEAVLNGTTNYVLDSWQNGMAIDEAIACAQAAGFAESDPSRDLSGQDAAEKLVLIHRQLTGDWLLPEAVRRKPFDRALFAKENDSPRDRCHRQVATWSRRDGHVVLRVAIRQLSKLHPLARLRRQENGALIRDANGRHSFIRGKGAGCWPTTEAVIADLFDLIQTPRAPSLFPVPVSTPTIFEEVDS